MKFIVSTTALLKGLQEISGEIDSRSLPILRCFLLEINEGKMMVTAANRKTYRSKNLKIESNASGCFAMSARILLDTLKCLPEEPLTFKINKETFRVEITSQTGCNKLRGANAVKLIKEIRRSHPYALLLKNKSD